jgi:hypothetical protein
MLLKSMILISCFSLIIGCGLHQSVKNSNALSDIRIGMTENEVEDRLVWLDGERGFSNFYSIVNRTGERFVIKWYRIEFDISKPMPFVYKNNILFGFGSNYLKQFADINGFELMTEKRGREILSIPVTHEVYAYRTDNELYQMIAKYDPDLPSRIKKYKTDSEAFEKDTAFWEKNAENWNTQFEKINKEQSAYLKSLDTKQLEFYTKYEDAIKENKAGAKELYLRQLSNSLSVDQRTRLSLLSDLALNLEDRKKILNEQNEKLFAEKNRLKDEQASIANRLESILQERAYQAKATRDAQLSQYRMMADGLNDMAEIIKRNSAQRDQIYYEQQQRFQMNQINNSLWDISRAIRK